MLDDKRIKELIDEVAKKVFSEQDMSQVNPIPQSPPPSQPKTTVVQFDKSTDAPFEVTFTERGFLIDDTRLSFEELEKALSKNYDIVLNGGKGFHLTQVRMQKIMKYKDV